MSQQDDELDRLLGSLGNPAGAEPLMSPADILAKALPPPPPPAGLAGTKLVLAVVGSVTAGFVGGALVVGGLMHGDAPVPKVQVPEVAPTEEAPVQEAPAGPSVAIGSPGAAGGVGGNPSFLGGTVDGSVGGGQDVTTSYAGRSEGAGGATVPGTGDGRAVAGTGRRSDDGSDDGRAVAGSGGRSDDGRAVAGNGGRSDDGRAVAGNGGRSDDGRAVAGNGGRSEDGRAVARRGGRVEGERSSTVQGSDDGRAVAGSDDGRAVAGTGGRADDGRSVARNGGRSEGAGSSTVPGSDDGRAVAGNGGGSEDVRSAARNRGNSENEDASTVKEGPLADGGSDIIPGSSTETPSDLALRPGSGAGPSASGTPDTEVPSPEELLVDEPSPEEDLLLPRPVPSTGTHLDISVGLNALPPRPDGVAAFGMLASVDLYHGFKTSSGWTPEVGGSVELVPRSDMLPSALVLRVGGGVGYRLTNLTPSLDWTVAMRPVSWSPKKDMGGPEDAPRKDDPPGIGWLTGPVLRVVAGPANSVNLDVQVGVDLGFRPEGVETLGRLALGVSVPLGKVR